MKMIRFLCVDTDKLVGNPSTFESANIKQPAELIITWRQKRASFNAKIPAGTKGRKAEMLPEMLSAKSVKRKCG